MFSLKLNEILKQGDEKERASPNKNTFNKPESRAVREKLDF